MVRTHNDDNGSYILDIDQHVPYVNPSDYGIADFPSIRPLDYFTTSGDAVVKATYLDKDLWKVAGEAAKRFGKSDDPRHLEFVKRTWSAAGKCRALLNLLKKVRGTNVFLEIEWRDHMLYCIPKNPRKKDVL